MLSPGGVGGEEMSAIDKINEIMGKDVDERDEFENAIYHLWDQGYTEVAHQLLLAVESLRKWKDAITDAGVVNWTLSEENANDPQKAIADLLSMQWRQALDPAVSQEAAALRRKAAELAWEAAVHARGFSRWELEFIQLEFIQQFIDRLDAPDSGETPR